MEETAKEVKIVDVRIPFLSVCILVFKFAAASICVSLFTYFFILGLYAFGLGIGYVAILLKGLMGLG